MEWVASTLHNTSEHGVSSITTADVHTSAASSQLNLCPRQFKWARPFRRKTSSGFCACVIIFQMKSTNCSKSNLCPAAKFCACVIIFQMKSTNCSKSNLCPAAKFCTCVIIFQMKSTNCSKSNLCPAAKFCACHHISNEAY